MKDLFDKAVMAAAKAKAEAARETASASFYRLRSMELENLTLKLRRAVRHLLLDGHEADCPGCAEATHVLEEAKLDNRLPPES
jgi:hypothetical protein